VWSTLEVQSSDLTFLHVNCESFPSPSPSPTLTSLHLIHSLSGQGRNTALLTS
jgi:hypothetical protein